ncbi:hypothetical protein PTKIN_Ptkin06aG0149100 [Pterospermum kingtungense]
MISLSLRNQLKNQSGYRWLKKMLGIIPVAQVARPEAPSFVPLAVVIDYMWTL